MSSIDDRIVSIKFDNAGFEKRLEETLRSLDKLRQSLNFSGSEKSLQAVSEATKGFNLNPVSASIESVNAGFLALGTVAITVLSRITNAAITAGTNITRSLSLAPVLQGFQEYEVNMNAIQTILANTSSKGSTLEDVNAALDQLNEYSDQTIYNFSEMARNIGTFTAAGVDLDASVNAIKGIANLAAISGSNSQQASMAMYQLSQALAAGRVNLMDWNSVVAAGMGGEVFKTALFETGKAMRTITNVPLSATFDEWEEKGGTFRDQMQSGWLTAEVLSTTLEAFSGDLDHATLSALGFSDAAAQEMLRLGELGIASATEVKTATQLLSTVQESIASGWSQSFRIIIGDFEQAKELFTEINNAISGFVSRSASARNELLDGWAWLGGRRDLIDGLRSSFQALGYVLTSISSAFRSVFPRKTSLELFALTERFKEFAQTLAINVARNLPKIRTLFQGLFSAVSIVLEVFRGFGTIMQRVWANVAPNIPVDGILDFFLNLAENITALRRILVDNDGLVPFFNRIASAITDPVNALTHLRRAFEILQEKIGHIINFDPSGFFDRMGESAGFVGGVIDFLGNVWGAFTERFSSILGVLDDVWQEISTWFSGLGQRISDALSATDFNAAIDIINVGLLGGILIALRNFLQNGIDIDVTGGFFDNINEALGELTETLSAMQAELRSSALLKIAGALALLTASVVVLAMIDSEALTKALTALSVGFGQLVLAMSAITHFQTGFSAAKMVAIGTGLMLLAGAATILSLAVRNLSGLEWEELAKGLVGITVMLTALSVSANLLSGNTSGLIRAGLGMIGISIGLLILSQAVKSFSDLEWDEMARGLVGMSVGLLAVTLAMRAMPTSGMVAAGLGVTAIATGLLILSYAVKSFSDLDWDEMAKGLIGVSVGLAAIVLLTNFIPAGGLIGIGAGLILVSTALNIMAAAVASMGSLKIDEMAKGIGGLAALLLILVVATNMMSGTLLGAGALFVVSSALLILSEVLIRLSTLSLAQIGAGLLAIAGAFVVIGVAGMLLGGIVPALLGLGGALLLIGAGFALFGVGAGLVAEAFKIIAETGEAGVGALINIIELAIGAIPRLFSAILHGVSNFLTEFTNVAPPLLEGFKVLIIKILDVIIELVPKIVEAGIAIATGFLAGIREIFPEVVETGLAMLIALLTGIRDNIGEIVTLVAEIITGFLDALAEKVPEIIDSVYNLLIAVIEGVIDKLADIGQLLLPKGLELIGGLIQGLSDKLPDVATWFTNLPGQILGFIGDLLLTLIGKGIDLISGLLTGITSKFVDVANWYVGLPGRILGFIGDVGSTLVSKGTDLISGLITGITSKFTEVMSWFMNIPSRIKNVIPNPINILKDIGRQIIDGLWQGMQDVWDDVTGWFGSITDAIPILKGPESRDKTLLVKSGELIMQGLQTGLSSEWSHISKWLNRLNPADDINNDALKNIGSTLSTIINSVENMDDFQPTITPVLDLTNVTRDAKSIGKLISASTITANVSTDQAKLISHTTEEARNTPPPEDDSFERPTEIKFEQNIYSPTALSANDIYRNTKGQIALAKEELKIS